MTAELTRIIVKELYGRFDHDITLHPSGITLIHGPNGCGKSTILMLVRNVLDNKLARIWSTPFRELTLMIGSEWSLSIRPKSLGDSGVHAADPEREQWRKWRKAIAELSADDADRLLDGIEAEVDVNGCLVKDPFIKIDDSESAKRSLLEDPEALFAEAGRLGLDIERNPRVLASEVQILRSLVPQEFGDEISQHLRVGVRSIGSDRLIDQLVSPRSRRGFPSYYNDRESRKVPAIKVRADQAKRMLNEMERASALKGQELDPSFLERAIFSGATPKQSESELREAYEEQKKILYRVTKAGMRRVESPVGDDAAEPGVRRRDRAFIQMPSLPKEQLESAQIVAVDIFTADTRGKIEPYERELEKVELFCEIINRHFDGKRISLSPDFGLQIRDDARRTVPLDGLSSGEQHVVVMTWDMIFGDQAQAEGGLDRNAPASPMLFLVDEPEISLHVQWQRAFLHDIKRIRELTGHAFIIATHSPQIVGEDDQYLVDMGVSGADPA